MQSVCSLANIYPARSKKVTSARRWEVDKLGFTLLARLVESPHQWCREPPKLHGRGGLPNLQSKEGGARTVFFLQYQTHPPQDKPGPGDLRGERRQNHGGPKALGLGGGV